MRSDAGRPRRRTTQSTTIAQAILTTDGERLDTERPALDLERPRDLRALLATAFQLYRSHFLVFATTAVLVVVVVDGLLIGVGGGVLASGPDSEPAMGWAVAGGVGSTLIGTPLITAMHVRAVQAIGRAERPRVGRTVLEGIAVFPVVALVILLGLSGTALGLLLLIIPGLYLSTIWFVGAQAAVVESLRSPTRALSRSSELVDGSFWRVFGISLLLLLMGGLAAELFAVPLLALGDHLDSGVISLAGIIAADAVSLSFVALAGTLFYFDLVARETAADDAP